MIYGLSINKYIISNESEVWGGIHLDPTKSASISILCCCIITFNNIKINLRTLQLGN